MFFIFLLSIVLSSSSSPHPSSCVPDTARVTGSHVHYPCTDPDCLSGHFDSGEDVAPLSHDSGSVLCHTEGTSTTGGIQIFRNIDSPSCNGLHGSHGNGSHGFSVHVLGSGSEPESPGLILLFPNQVSLALGLSLDEFGVESAYVELASPHFADEPRYIIYPTPRPLSSYLPMTWALEWQMAHPNNASWMVIRAHFGDEMVEWEREWLPLHVPESIRPSNLHWRDFRIGCEVSVPQLPVCFGINCTSEEACSAHGSCIATNTCVCDEPYTGPDCLARWQADPCEWLPQFPDLWNQLRGSSGCHNDSAVRPCENHCGIHGLCLRTSEERCLCKEGWHGIRCNGLTTQPCEPTCSSHGQCREEPIGEETVCECQLQWFGSTCNLTSCDGIRSDDEDVCFGTMDCVEPDICVQNCSSLVAVGLLVVMLVWLNL